MVTVSVAIFSEKREFPHLTALSQEINAMWELEEREFSLLGFVQGNSTSSFEIALWHLSFLTTEIISSLC